MESHKQAFFLADDSPLNCDANICNLQSEVQMQLESSECPVIHEPSTLETPVLQEGGMNTGSEQAELADSGMHGDDNSVLENGRGPDSSDIDFNKRCIVSSDDVGAHMHNASAMDDTFRAGVCIGTIVSVHKDANACLPKQSAAEATGAHKTPVTASGSMPENRIDYGESVAMEDFGGEFEDGHGIDESTFASVSIFADSNMSKHDTADAAAAEMNVNDGSVEIHATAAQDDAVNTSLEEQLDVPESLDKILPKSPADEESAECEEEPPILEREVVSKAGHSKQRDEEEDDDAEKWSSKLPSRKLRRHSEAASGDTEQSVASNLELNVNSRPRRSVNRKSVFELLHVDYRVVGGPKKVATHRASDGEVNDESPPKKQKSCKKGTKVSTKQLSDSTETRVKMKRLLSTNRDHMQDIDDKISALKKKVIGYKPDDFLEDGEVEPEVTNNSVDKDEKNTLATDKSSFRESLFTEADDLAARSFLSTFAAETADALSSSKQEGNGGIELDALIAENQELRSRIKTLEQSKSLVKKFNIDFHGRKFSRIRSPAIVPSDQQKTPGKIGGSEFSGTPATERKVQVESSESMLSRIAVLDRREHKVRELNAELDERATSVKIAEGALRRRERKLLDFEKTLEHRERVLSRHEQSILKRELILGSPTLTAGDPPVEDGEDRQSLAAEIQRRLEQRRLELDRRQAAVESERARLEAREQEVVQREARCRTAVESSHSADKHVAGSADAAHRGTSRPSKRLTSVRNQKGKTSVSNSIRSKYLTPKKQKVSATPVSAARRKSTATPGSVKKGYTLRSIRT